MQAITQFKQTLTVEQAAPRFKRDVAGWILAVLNALMALNSTFVFLFFLEVGVAGWLMMNSCAPSIALFLLGFLLASPVVMVAGALLMFRYGTLGLFVFSWQGTNLIAQIGHLLMTLAVIYVMVDIVRHKRWKRLVLGLALGAAILIPFMIVQDMWLNAHPDLVEMLFSGDWE